MRTGRVLTFRRPPSRVQVATLLLLVASPAFAHSAVSAAHGFLDGWAHPFTGFDHIVTMAAVGVWAARLGRRAMWLLPLTFMLGMAAGAWLGVGTAALSAVEISVMGSALLLGAIALVRPRMTLLAACTLAGIGAAFHGHAHGVDMPDGVSAAMYIAGLVSATGLLHALGIALALLARWSDGHDRHLVRPPTISILRVPVLLRLPRSR